MFLTAYLGAFFNTIDRKKSLLADKRTSIGKFCAQAIIDKKIEIKMYKTLDHHETNNYFELFNKNCLLQDIPLSLRCTIAMNVNNQVLGKFKFFHIIDEALLGSIVTYLQPLQLDAGVFVYRKGDIANESISFYI